MSGRLPNGTPPHTYQPGDYGKWGGDWYCRCPVEDEDAIGNLRAHDVTEHEDGTITVSPSILVRTTRAGQPVELYHGWLEHGVWRNA